MHLSAIGAQRRVSRSGGGLGFLLEGFLPADRRAAELEHVGVVHEAVADRVGDSRIRRAPGFARHVACRQLACWLECLGSCALR